MLTLLRIETLCNRYKKATCHRVYALPFTALLLLLLFMVGLGYVCSGYKVGLRGGSVVVTGRGVGYAQHKETTGRLRAIGQNETRCVFPTR